jgi:hypothetical protein
MSRRVWRGCWQVFGLAGVPIHANGASTNPSSRFFGKPVVLGCSFLLTAAGQFRFHTGFPLTFPHETSPANAPQHTVSFRPCQPKCCAFVKFWTKCSKL